MRKYSLNLDAIMSELLRISSCNTWRIILKCSKRGVFISPVIVFVTKRFKTYSLLLHQHMFTLCASSLYVHLTTWATGDSRVAGPGSGQRREGSKEQDLPGQDPGVLSLKWGYGPLRATMAPQHPPTQWPNCESLLWSEEMWLTHGLLTYRTCCVSAGFMLCVTDKWV